MKHFPIDHPTLVRVLGHALSRGGDYADIYFEHSFSGSVTLQDESVNRAASNIDYGAGVRVVYGNKTGYAYVENITPETLMQAAKTASRIAEQQTAEIHLNDHLTTLHATEEHYPISQSWADTSIAHLIPYLQTLRQRILETEPRIIRVQAAINYRTRYIACCNSLGDIYEEVRPIASVRLSCVIKDGKQHEQAHISRSYCMGAEMLSESLLDTLCCECVRKARFALSATQPHGGVMPVVMAAGAGGILLHEAIGHAFEADFNRRDESIFSNMLGKTICHPTISVVDDGTIIGNRGAINFDDECVKSQKTYIVQDGVLTSYLHDRISAKHYGVAPTGNGRRESFRHMPIPRMRSTYMDNGNTSENDLISDVQKGIYVQDFTNGQVQIGAGDFTFFVKSGYLIENGQLTQPIKDINIIGNGPQALSDIQGVANNLLIDDSTWMCGKDGQSCPVTCGMPSVLVSKLTVGGI